MTCRLGRWIEGADLTATQFGERCGITQAMMSRLLDGNRRPSFEMMRRIADVTNGIGSDVSDYLHTIPTPNETYILRARVHNWRLLKDIERKTGDRVEGKAPPRRPRCQGDTSPDAHRGDPSG